jgi:pimeloyl-ACP methyl ester carboxylesterase
MKYVTSRDGTRIACHESGAGAPLVLVHGTSAASTRWKPVLPALEQHARICAMDRRGRGESGDSATYTIEREFEDIAAVVDAAGVPVDLLGHSYGGLCALEAALLTPNLRKLVLYEPPIPVAGVPIYPDGIVERLQALLDAGDREAVVLTFMREVVRMPPHEEIAFRSSPAWPARVAAAHTLPRELRVHQQYTFDAGRFAALQVPTLLLLGGDSPDFFQAATQAVDNALPNSRVVVLPGQQHIAIDTAPERFTQEVVRFLANEGGSV